jgi:hypothetical protein
MREHKVACYYGVMVQPKSKVALKDDLKEVRLAQSEASEEDEVVKVNDDDQVLHADDLDNDSLIQIAAEPEDHTNLYLFEEFMMPAKKRRAHKHIDFVPREETDLLIETINSLDLGWKADTCMLRKEKGSKKCEEPLNLAQTSRIHGKALYQKGDGYKAAVEEAQAFMKKYEKPEDIPDDELPENFDWRNVKGYDFVAKPKN